MIKILVNEDDQTIMVDLHISSCHKENIAFIIGLLL